MTETLNVQPVDDLDDPRVEVYRSLRRISQLKREGRFVAEGARVVRKPLVSSLTVHSLLVDQRWLDEFEVLLRARPDAGFPIYLTSKKELERIVGFRVHQGVMAVAEAPWPPDLLRHATATPDHVFVALAGVSSHENVGGVLRTMAGFGVSGLLIDPATCDPFVRRAARVSMGAVFEIPVWRADDLPATIRQLREHCGTRSIAAHLHDPCTDLDRADLSGNILLALGSEADGLPDNVVEACDVSVRIPMDPTWDCFNVGTAGAVFLWEIFRRR